MAHLHKKIKKGRPYYYIREMARVDGKPKVVNQVYLGSPERMMELARAAESPPVKLSVQEFGALWMANQIDRMIDLKSIIDSVIPQRKNEKGPSVGEYFLFAVLNRLVDSQSKRAFPQWFKDSAISEIRPVDPDRLTSQRFWDKWDRVDETQIQEIGRLFFQKVASIEPPGPGCFLFDTTNYYTYLATETESELAQRAKNKDGKDWLRQIGLALLVSRQTRLPLFYREYVGNNHDSKLFGEILDDIPGKMSELVGEAADLTVVVDKGMNAEKNRTFFDQSDRLHFVTTYSTYFSPELMAVDLSDFRKIDIAKNRMLAGQGKEQDQIIAFRTSGTFWERERAVVVTFNPRTARKQRYNFERRMLKLKTELQAMQSKMRDQRARWRTPKEIEKRYRELCDKLHLSRHFYDLTFELTNAGWRMTYRKNNTTWMEYLRRLGKNILVTDRMDWSDEEIVQAALDRYLVENAFRQTKDDDLVSALPIRHWTDGKIRCHLLTCMIALTYLGLIQNRLNRAGLKTTATTAVKQMRQLHSCLCWMKTTGKPARILEQPTQAQADILKAFHHFVTSSGVLQPISV
jgi:transposase